MSFHRFKAASLIWIIFFLPFMPRLFTSCTLVFKLMSKVEGRKQLIGIKRGRKSKIAPLQTARDLKFLEASRYARWSSSRVAQEDVAGVWFMSQWGACKSLARAKRARRRFLYYRPHYKSEYADSEISIRRF